MLQKHEMKLERQNSALMNFHEQLNYALMASNALIASKQGPVDHVSSQSSKGGFQKCRKRCLSKLITIVEVGSFKCSISYNELSTKL